jgi:hypothetical protein
MVAETSPQSAVWQQCSQEQPVHLEGGGAEALPPPRAPEKVSQKQQAPAIASPCRRDALATSRPRNDRGDRNHHGADAGYADVGLHRRGDE